MTRLTAYLQTHRHNIKLRLSEATQEKTLFFIEAVRLVRAKVIVVSEGSKLRRRRVNNECCKQLADVLHLVGI